MTRDPFGLTPSRAVSFAVSAALVVVWGLIRLVLFDTMTFPLTYVLPMLVCIWTRDRLALWGMAAVFATMHVAKLYAILPDGSLTETETTANLVATLANIGLGGLGIHAIIVMRSRLEAALRDVHAQAEELRAQSEELAQQNEELTEQAEELARQTEELSQQGEELASQNEELQAQSEEIGTLNQALARKEQLLETLLDTARLTGAEDAALQHVAEAARELFGGVCAVAAVYERDAAGLRLRAVASGSPFAMPEEPAIVEDAFAALVLEQRRPAALNDTSLRPDLAPPALPGLPPVRARLGAPVQFGADVIGVFAIYGERSHDWTREQFQLAAWLADQCGRIMRALRVQAALRDADRRKTEFLATLSHELRNPLAPIRFALKLFERGETGDGNALRIMQRQFRQLVRLVDDLLDATRLSSNKIQLRRTRSDLVATVQQAVEASTPDIGAARHELSVVLPTEPVWLEMDADRIAQVVANLLNNATRYTPAGGRVTVTLTTSGGEAVLSVADTGVGLEPEDAGRVFDMFTQVGGPGSGGLGIGLAIVRGIVELHGGRVGVRSDGTGRGCAFHVVLPRDPVPQTGQRGPSHVGSRPASSPRRVLVVDDNVDATEMMAALLEMHGHAVWAAHDAAGALRVAEAVVPDVALLDIGLPDLDGYELARRLRENVVTGRMRLVAVTGWGQDGDREKARAAGFDAHLTKPAEPEAVLSVLGLDAIADGLAQSM